MLPKPRRAALWMWGGAMRCGANRRDAAIFRADSFEPLFRGRGFEFFGQGRNDLGLIRGKLALDQFFARKFAA
jgi:hypothetical protein